MILKPGETKLKSLRKNLCPICGGTKKAGTTTYTADIGSSVIVVRNVQASICDQCGEEWIPANTARQLEEIINDARKNKRQVEIIAL